MFAVRSAIMAIGLVSWLTAASEQSRALAVHGEVVAFRLPPTIVRPAAFSVARASKLTYYTPWKARPKMFLGESDNPSGEASFEPVLFPRALSSSTSAITAEFRTPGLSPLRC